MKKIILCLLLALFSGALFANPVQDSIDLQHRELRDLGLSDKAIDKLSPEQIVKIYAIHQMHGFHPGANGKHVFVPFVVFIAAVVIVFLVLFFNYKKTQSLHRIIYKSVETGAPIPLDLLTKAASGRKVSDLKKGIVLISVGLGLILVLYIEQRMWSVGFLPLIIGIGFLIVNSLDKKGQSNEDQKLNG